jgi:hypothetical protein
MRFVVGRQSLSSGRREVRTRFGCDVLCVWGFYCRAIHFRGTASRVGVLRLAVRAVKAHVEGCFLSIAQAAVGVKRRGKEEHHHPIMFVA